MDYTPQDIGIMMQQGDVGDFIKLVGGLDTTTSKRTEEKVKCPWCKAQPGNRCTTPQGHRLTAGIHQARIDAYHKPEQHRTPGAWPTAGRRTDPWI